MRRTSVLCLGARNTVRSQMAEGFLRVRGAGSLEVYSAGLTPAEIDPLAHQVMEEVGVRLTGQRSKSVREYLGRLTVQHAILIGERSEAGCPKLFPGAVQSHAWAVPDPSRGDLPAEARLAAFRDVRDGIEGRVLEWLEARGRERPVTAPAQRSHAELNP